MKLDCIELIFLTSSLVTMALAKPNLGPNIRISVGEGPSRNGDESHLGDVKILGQPGETLLNNAMAVMAPWIGRIVRVAPIVGAASNSVTGNINNDIVSGFAIPVTDEFLDYYERILWVQNRAVTDQKTRMLKERSSAGISKNFE